MANVNNLTSNSYSSSTSLYGTRNVLTGLASGMDTETMIQNSVTGYQTKISDLQKQQTKVEWKQDAYRDLIDEMYSITNKYTSYTSKTNLASNSFFTSARTTAATGENASAVSVSGVSASDIQINAVEQLATATRYAISSSAMNLDMSSEAAGTAINWSQSSTRGTLSGSLTLKLGSSSVDIKFTADDKYESLDDLVAGINSKLEDQSANVKATLDGDKITFEATGAAQTAGDAVYLSGVSGNLKTLLNVETASSSVDENRFNYTSFTLQGDVSSLTETTTVGKQLAGKTLDITLDGTTKQITIGEGLTSSDELKADLQKSIDKAFGTGRLTVGTTDEGGLRFDVKEGSGSQVKVTSSDAAELLGIGEAGLSNYFNTGKSLGDLLDTSWLNANAREAKTLDESVAARYFDADGKELAFSDGEYYQLDTNGKIKTKDGEKVTGTLANTLYTDTDGNLIKKANTTDDYYRVNEKGEWMYELKINGATVDGLTEGSSLESVKNAINSNADAGVNVSYSSLSGQFVFASRELGQGGKIEFGDGLAKRLFTADATGKALSDTFGAGNDWSGATVGGVALPGAESLSDSSTLEDLRNVINNAGYSFKIEYDEMTNGFSFVNASTGKEIENFERTIKVGDKTYQLKNVFQSNGGVSYSTGTDAVVRATVNGTELELTRSSNLIEMDGMSVTLKSTFTDGEAISFATSTKSDDVIDTVKSFVDDVNKLMTDLHSAYTTQPLKKSSSSSTKRDGYEPLTEDDKSGMSETAIKNYEEKAKTGLLFGDTDLSSCYQKLLNAIQKSGSDRIDMESIGLSTTYSNGVTQLKLDEDKLRTALENDPDKVRSVFTKTKESGSASDGLMASLKSTLNAYASISLGSQGLLVKKAGTKLSSVSLLSNTLQSQLNNLDSQIEKWQSRLSDKVDYYTKQFTQLEKLMSTMNNQSSMLSDLMGY